MPGALSMELSGHSQGIEENPTLNFAAVKSKSETSLEVGGVLLMRVKTTCSA